MRSPHLVFTAAIQGVTGRLGRGREAPPAASAPDYVSLVGRVQPALEPTDLGVCNVAGCGAPATVLAEGPAGGVIAFCARCAEEFGAILAEGADASTPQAES